MIKFGKQIAGPVKLFHVPILWGGCLFLHVWIWSAMIILPDWFIQAAAIVGIDCIGD